MTRTDRARSLRVLRVRARLSRYLALGAVALLALAGLRAALQGPADATLSQPTRVERDLEARGLAEAFAREYLSWDAARPEEYERRVRRLITDTAAEQLPLLPTTGREVVRWTAAVGQGQVGARSVTTVAAQTSTGIVYLAVPVSRGPRGFLRVDAPPAIVGPQPIDRAHAAPAEREVEDGRLVTVVERALRNYLVGARANLVADLAPDAIVSLPAERLDIVAVEPPAWAVHGRRVGVLVTARRPNGVELQLRYELEVVRRDRWYVRSIGTDPSDKGGSP